MKKIIVILGLIAVIVIGIIVINIQNTPAISAISREGVITQIQKLSRLESVAFSVDTVITAQKEGSWQKLWQDGQKGLFVTKGRVLAGVDLSKISPEMVQVTFDKQTDKSIPPHANIDITLPPSEVFEVFLDDIQIYDWQTGLFGVVDNDPEILSKAQVSAKAEILSRACDGDVMNLATKNASEQVQGLFMLTGATVTIHTQGSGACHL